MPMARRSSVFRGSNHGSHDLIEVVVRPKKYYRTRSSSQSNVLGARDKVYVEPKENRRIIKNLAVLSLSMSLLYVAYQGTLNLQSSLNAEGGLGTNSLTIIYVSLGVSCLFLPTLIIRKLTCKWTLVFSFLCFTPYIALQLYPRYATLMPSGILLGVAAGPMWAAQATYCTQISQIYAIVTEGQMDAVIVWFFGIFYLCWQNADTVGNVLSSLVLGAEKGANEDSNETVSYASCGSRFCGEGEAIERPDETRVFHLIMIYLPCVVMSSVLVAIFLDPMKRYGEGRKGAQEETMKELLLATFHQMRRPTQQMLIPITWFIGMEQAYVAAEFTQAFVACALGVSKIGFVLSAWGFADSLACLFFGFVTKYIGRRLIIMLGAAINICIIGFKLHWKPNPDNIAVFFVVSILWGICDAIWVTQINGLYGLIFRRHKEAAFSNYRFFEACGFVTSFAISKLLCVASKLLILYATLTFGLIGYITVEIMYQNKQGNYRLLDKMERLAMELQTEEGRSLAKTQAHVAEEKIKKGAQHSDGEDDALEDDIVVKR